MEIYCKIFELDWKLDKDLVNRQEFMYTNPIYLDGENIKSYGELNNEAVIKMIQKACVPFVEEATQKILNHA